MEALFILGGWIAAVAGVGVGITRPWTSPAARDLRALIPATLTAAWVIGSGFMAYRQMMADGAWTGASIAIAFVPAKAIVLSLLAYAAGRAFQSARTSGERSLRNWMLPGALAAVLVYAVGSDVTALHANRLERHAANSALTQDQAQELAQKIRRGGAQRGEAAAFLGNPKCPADLLAEYAASADPYWRTAAARNDAIDPVVAAKLARDADEQVRFYLAFNRKLPADILAQLAADSSDSVRDVVVWTDGLPDESFDRLVDDPSAKVRATAALQPRLSKTQRDKLRRDPEQRVRDAAYRYGGE